MQLTYKLLLHPEPEVCYTVLVIEQAIQMANEAIELYIAELRTTVIRILRTNIYLKMFYSFGIINAPAQAN